MGPKQAMVCHLRRCMEGPRVVTEMTVSRENRERNRVLLQWFSVWTLFPASLCVSAPGHNLLLSKVSCVCVCVCDEKRHEMHCWEEDIY